MQKCKYMPVNQFYLASRQMPFVRLFIALAGGILLQWYCDISPVVITFVFVISLLGYLLFLGLSSYAIYRYGWLRGICILVMLAACGSAISYVKNRVHNNYDISKVYTPGDAVVATVSESLLAKPNTYKANALVNGIYHHKKFVPASGTVIIYFDKKNLPGKLGYGSQVLFVKPIEPIQNSGNPGAINYQRYLLFSSITAQVYLRSSDYALLPQKGVSPFQSSIQQVRMYVINAIQTYIPGKPESGVAEALLIGYRNDLDKDLVQLYSNTGVVHIIAISGLHLGMIYGFILLLFSSYKHAKWYRFTVPLVALITIWLFTLLAGAVPSILRSAVTFSFMAAGIFINRKTNIYNTLAASAFCLLLFNPFLLWDVGFQLSYAAVLGILVFTKPLFNCWYIGNKWLSKLWQLTCVNIAAQIFTLPLVLYNFHQFPMLFLLNNLFVIPLSEFILFSTLLLVLISKWALLAIPVGKFSQLLLSLMNSFIGHTEKLPFSLLSNIKMDVVQALLLYSIIILLALWLLYKLPRFLLYSFVPVLAFVVYTFADVEKAVNQNKLIVYNINKHFVADVVWGRKATCFSDSSLATDKQANNFYLKPSRTLYRIQQCTSHVINDQTNVLLHANGKTVLLLSKPYSYTTLREKPEVDVVLICGNPKLYINDLYNLVTCKCIVAGNTVSAYKLKRWRQDCDSLHIPFYAIAQQGAFITDL